MKRSPLFIGIATLVLLGCVGTSFSNQPTPAPTLFIAPTWTFRPLPSPTETFTPIPTFIPTETPTTVASVTLTLPPSLTPEPQWSLQGPGEVIIPILVYHHIDFSPSNGRYYVSPAEFERQMYLLHEWGYKTISVELLATAIKKGALLPPRPILLTFDDGTLSTINNAFPIMQKYNFTGTTYVIYNYIGTTNYMNADDLRALVAAGWEIGSHSLSHENLAEQPKRQNNEIVESRRRLQSLLEVPILSFAYPFGAYDKGSLQYVRDAGYTAAMGLGNTARQNNQNIFYLYRRAIEGDTTLQSFVQMLPWREASPDPAVVTVLP